MLVKTDKYQLTDNKERIKAHISDVKKLLQQSYWAKERTLEKIEKSIEGSLCFAFFDTESDKIVAFARVVTDFATMYYLCDVIVDEGHRGKGLGKMLVNRIADEDERLKGLYGILLTSDAQGLYSQYGFSEYQKSCMCKFWG